MVLAGQASTVGTLPDGHKNSDLRDVMCNIRLSRLRDITLRRDVSLYEEGKAVALAPIFKVFPDFESGQSQVVTSVQGKRALLVGIPGGKVCCQQHLPTYLDKVRHPAEALLRRMFL